MPAPLSFRIALLIRVPDWFRLTSRIRFSHNSRSIKCNRSKTEELVDHRPENWRQEVDKIIDIPTDDLTGSLTDDLTDDLTDSLTDPHSHSQNQNHENQKTRHQNQKPLTEKSNTEDEGNISATTTPPDGLAEPLDFEPGGREFESLRARNTINKLAASSGPLIFRVGTM